MNVHSAMQAGREGILFTIASITGTLVFGFLMGKWLNIEQKHLTLFPPARLFAEAALLQLYRR